MLRELQEWKQQNHHENLYETGQEITRFNKRYVPFMWQGDQNENSRSPNKIQGQDLERILHGKVSLSYRNCCIHQKRLQTSLTDAIRFRQNLITFTLTV